MLKTALIAAMAVLICAASTPAFAAMLKYVDKAGQSHFVDEYEKVPPEYRDQLKGQIEIEDDTADKNPSRPVAKPRWLPSPDAAQPQSIPIENINPAAPSPSPPAALAALPAVKDTGLLDKVAEFTENSSTGLVVKILAAIIILAVFLTIGVRIFSDLKGKKLGVLILISITLGVLFYLTNTYLKKMDATFKTVKGQIREIEKKMTGRNAAAESALKDMQLMEAQAIQGNAAAAQAAQEELMREQTRPPAEQP